MLGVLEKVIKCQEDVFGFHIKDIYKDDGLYCVKAVICGYDVDFMYYDNIDFLMYWKTDTHYFDILRTGIETYYDIKLER